MGWVGWMREGTQSTLPNTGRIFNYADKLTLYNFFYYFYNIDDLEWVVTLKITGQLFSTFFRTCPLC